MLKFLDTLGPLANPDNFQGPVNLENLSEDWALWAYRMMVLIRRTEETIANLYEAGETKTPIHLGIGQEAVAVGISSALAKSDKVYSNHRSHSHYLALSADVNLLIAEILGRKTGASRGMGGSMHLYAPEVGFQGSVPIVGATIPIAVGASMACKMDGSASIAVCYFGDGACEEGVLHESLNLARVMELPIIFVCENNLYSSHLDIHLRQPSNSVARFAKAHDIPSHVVDGNDVAAVAKASHDFAARARNGMGPGFIEAVTFRWRGHVGPNVDLDVGVRRSVNELEAWKLRDPIRRLADSIISSHHKKQDLLDAIESDIQKQLKDAIVMARGSPSPDPSVLLDYVYEVANGPV